jgi:hypothetical protein
MGYFKWSKPILCTSCTAFSAWAWNVNKLWPLCISPNFSRHTAPKALKNENLWDGVLIGNTKPHSSHGDISVLHECLVYFRESGLTNPVYFITACGIVRILMSIIFVAFRVLRKTMCSDPSYMRPEGTTHNKHQRAYSSEYYPPPSHGYLGLSSSSVGCTMVRPSQWPRGLKGPIHVRVWLASPARINFTTNAWADFQLCDPHSDEFG